MLRIILPDQPIPEWYRLGLAGNTDLSIQIHRSVYEEIEPKLIAYSDPTTERSLGLPSFTSIQQNKWGYGEKLLRVGDNGNWISWHCPLPPDTGKGLEPENWLNANCIVATLSTILRRLNSVQSLTNLPSRQLVTVNLKIDPVTMGVDLSPSMCQWIGQQVGQATSKTVLEAMSTAYTFMYRAGGESTYKLRVDFESPCDVRIITFGNACSLTPQDELTCQTGYRLAPTNLDSVFQVLTLLVAIAKMSDMAREAGY